MVMTRGKDDEKALYDLLGNKDDRKKFDTQFKKAESKKGVRQRNDVLIKPDSSHQLKLPPSSSLLALPSST